MELNIDKDKYIKKLEKRIHNQRVALRRDWVIQETRMNHRPTPLRSMWFNHVIRLGKKIKDLRKQLNNGDG